MINIDLRALLAALAAAMESDPALTARIVAAVGTRSPTDAIVPCRGLGKAWRRVQTAVRAGELPGYELDRRGTIGVRRSEYEKWLSSKPVAPQPIAEASFAQTPERDEIAELVAQGRLRVVRRHR